MNSYSKSISDFLRNDTTLPVVLCIGSDRVIGDALGPIVGELLRFRHDAPCFVYGTLSLPVTAKNLTSAIAFIRRNHPQSKIIAIDSSLGNANDIGKITCKIGQIRPGLATGKKLPAVGDYSVTATVAPIGASHTLSSLRLDFVYRLAERVALIVSDGVSSGKTARQKPFSLSTTNII